MAFGVRMERLTRIIDADAVPPMTAPDGRKDSELSMEEARLWLLSQASRAAGGRVAYDDNIERWVVAGTGLVEKRCETCRKIFTPLRNDAKYDSPACRQAANRKRDVTVNGRWVSQ